MSNIPVIDLIFAILIFLMIIHGYVRGFIEELFSWAALVLAIWVAVLFYPQAAALIRVKIMQNVRAVPEILGFIAVFLAVMLVVKMVERILKDVVNGAKLKGVNKILGGAFGFIEGLALVTLIVFVLNIQPFFNFSGILSESIFGKTIIDMIKIPVERGTGHIDVTLGILPGPGR